MSSLPVAAIEAAEHLAKAIKPPTDAAISISTLFRPGKPLALKVFILPQFKYLESRVPESCDGFEVIREVAQRATAY